MSEPPPPEPPSRVVRDSMGVGDIVQSALRPPEIVDDVMLVGQATDDAMKPS